MCSGTPSRMLTDKDAIVLADFANSTGDAVFDDGLKQGLEVQLGQSPFLNLVSEEQVRQTLQMMKRPPDTKLTADIAREVCQRRNGSAVLQSSIAQIGTRYDLVLKAVSCSTGESLGSAEAQASDKNQSWTRLGGHLHRSARSSENHSPPFRDSTHRSLKPRHRHWKPSRRTVSAYPNSAKATRPVQSRCFSRRLSSTPNSPWPTFILASPMGS